MDNLDCPASTTCSLPVSPFCHNRFLTVILGHIDGLQGSGAVRLDPEHIQTGRPTLDGGRWQGQRVTSCVEPGADVHELARPQIVVHVGKEPP